MLEPNVLANRNVTAAEVGEKIQRSADISDNVDTSAMMEKFFLK